MILARAPLRIPLGGGGTDLPSFYHRFGGSLVTAAIDKYVYIQLAQSQVEDAVRLRYSRNETADHVDALEHDLAREILRSNRVSSGIEIVSTADLPEGAGLGSSASYAVALLTALHALRFERVDPATVAEEACHVEIDLLGRPTGKQDQYAAAFGGIVALEIAKDGQVKVERLELLPGFLREFQRNVLLFYTPTRHDAGRVLKGQAEASNRGDSGVIDRLQRIKEIGFRVREALVAGNLPAFGRLLDEHWQTKRLLSSGVSTTEIERWYQVARQAGALGGKIMGAGGGGCFMFCCPDDRSRLRQALAAEGLREVTYSVEFTGAVVLVDDRPPQGSSFGEQAVAQDQKVEV